MGFDLQGINPKLHSQEPDRDSDFHEYNSWLSENPGVYFRNNVWYWRPLWRYVCENCTDILSEKDMNKGQWNNGEKIGKIKSIKIARRLDKLLKKGEVHQYLMAYETWRDNQEKDEGERSPYPFDEDNVRNFSRFCRESGGFYIC